MRSTVSLFLCIHVFYTPYLESKHVGMLYGPMQLHIFGPAHGLPSIDAECLAAVALLRLYAGQGWELVATSDHSRPLPYLIHGSDVLQGFRSIANHLDRTSTHDHLPPPRPTRADSAAIASFLHADAQILLDISLYLSYENYSITRSAFTRFLPWYSNYIIPPRRRADARRRTEHLGISSIDVDDVHEDLSNRPATFDVGKEPKFEADTHKRASLLLPSKNTVSSLLRRPEHSAVFKLHALADNFFRPLQDMLGDNQYFSASHKPLTVDCMAYGYLSLMLYPELPHDWLAKTMRRKYDKLVAFTERMHETLKLHTDAADFVMLMKCKSEPERQSVSTTLNMALPWALPPPHSFSDMATAVAYDLATRVPMVGVSRVEIVHASPPRSSFWSNQYLPALLATTATSIGLLAYYAFKSGLFIWPHGDQLQVFGRKRFADYGHLGAALAGMSLLGQQGTNNVTIHPQNRFDKPVRAEVEVETDLNRRDEATQSLTSASVEKPFIQGPYIDECPRRAQTGGG